MSQQDEARQKPAGHQQRSDRRTRGLRRRTTAVLLAAVLLASGAAVGVIAATGGLGASGQGLPDPGPIICISLPVATVLRDLAAMVTVGLLVTAATVFPGPLRPVSPRLGSSSFDPALPALVVGDRGRGAERRGAELTPLQRRTVVAGAVAAAVWGVLTVVLLILSYVDLAGYPLTVETLAEAVTALPYFVTDFDLGRALGLSTAAVLVAVVVAASATGPGRVGVAAAVAVVAVVPLAWTGHAGGSRGHATAIDSQLVHLIAVTIWVGGLTALLVSHRQLGDQLSVAARRYSTMAGWCYGLAAAAGLIGATVRIDSWSALAGTDYGRILLAKTLLLVVLGIAGWRHRRRLLPQLVAEPGRRPFLQLVGGELLLMGIAVGLGVALSRSAPPVDTEPDDLATALLGYPMPPPLTLETVFGAWRPDPLWLALTAAGAITYLAGVWRLHRRRDRWPVARTVFFLLGCSLMVAATCGSPGVYGRVLFSMHMVQHMTIATAVPTFLVLGAPVTLALRALPHRRDGSRGPREWLLAALHCTPARLVTNPLVTVALFLGSMVAFYYTPALEIALRTHAGHLIMTAHFLLSGYLFANLICGIDPGPNRPPHLFRLLILSITFGFHAFFATSLMASGVLARSWYASLQRPWGPSLAEDQLLGASLGWALGDYPIAILTAGLLVSWIKSDTRAARRYDRHADRDGDAELAEYNDYLHSLNDRSGHPPRRQQTPREQGTLRRDRTEPPRGPRPSP